MKMQVLLAGAVIITATALSPARADYGWLPQTGATWGAGSVGAAEVTPNQAGEVNAPIDIGDNIDTNSETAVTLEYFSTDLVNHPVPDPADPQLVAFQVEWSGNINDLSEHNGHAHAHLSGDVYNGYPYVTPRDSPDLDEPNYVNRTKEYGTLTETDEVNETPWTLYYYTAAHYPAYDTLTQDTTVFVHLDRTAPYTAARAWYDDLAMDPGSAHAKSAAAAMSVVEDTIAISAWPF